VIALFGVLRAGMIAAPLPLLWRKQEMLVALLRCSAKAIITAARIGMSAPFRQSDIDAAVAATDTVVIMALPDAQLGQRLAGSAPDQVQTAARLQAAGVNALIVGALQQRHPPDLPYFIDKALTGLS
jgi:acyl-CoA synthetase (AMP-forming)/AMP-acid ligase II